MNEQNNEAKNITLEMMHLFKKGRYFPKNSGIKNYRLRSARLGKGLLGKDLAQRAGISQPQYYAIENLSCFPSEKAKEMIARVLGKDSNDLFPDKFREYSGQRVRSLDVFDNLKRVRLELDKLGKSVDYQRICELSFLNSFIMGLLDKIEEREKEIIKDRFGFRHYYSLREAAQKYHISKDRIVQFECRAIAKLRALIYSENLENSLADLR